MIAEADLNASDAPPTRRAWLTVVGGGGVVASVAVTIAIQPYQWNVITYVAELKPGVPHRALTIAFALLLTAAPVVCALAGSHRCWGRVAIADVIARLWPLVLSLPLAVAAWAHQGPIFPLSLLHIVGVGWAVEQSLRDWPRRRADDADERNRHAQFRDRGEPPTSVGADVPTSVRPEIGSHDSLQERASGTPQPDYAHRWAISLLLILVVLVTVIHTLIQNSFFEHFMLGHADMGHFAEELKNAIAGRGLRSDSFPNTRFGWHFTPLMYVLVPGYWLWPSPVFLMACSALLVHCAAFPIYWLARRLAASTLVAWLLAAAWLLHPSVSRLPYSGTYGFQWLYITLPLVIWWIGAGVQSRWQTFFILLAALLLCRETTALTTLGFGLYLAFACRRWKSGMAAAIISLVYAALCVAWIIPHFAASGEYERMQMFGSLGSSFTEVFASAITQPAEFFGRFVRHESIMFLAVLFVTLALAPIRSWKLAISALPALILILLLDNPEWLSVKFWYQVSVLPVWFVAAVTVATKNVEKSGTPCPEPQAPACATTRIGAIPGSPKYKRRTSTFTTQGDAFTYALSLLLCCAWGHYLLGFSPISKSYDVYAAEARLQSPDPLLTAVKRWRREIPRSATILATERLAAHFTDYWRIYTGKRPLPADFVIIDRQDHWDASGLPQRVDDYRADPTYRIYDTIGSIVVFERQPGMEVPPEE